VRGRGEGGQYGSERKLSVEASRGCRGSRGSRGREKRLIRTVLGEGEEEKNK